MMDFSYEIRQVRGREGAVITGFSGGVKRLFVPEELSGLPVLAVGKSAFRELPELTEVTLPDTVLSLGAYAFYHCPGLSRLRFTDSIEDLGDGAVRTCRSLFDLDADLRRGRWGILKDLLADGDGKKRLHITLPEERRLTLVFPQYVNDCVFTEYDITKCHARLEGSGYAYRTCLTREGFRAADYDSAGLFGRICLEDRVLSLLLAAGRLAQPYGLAAGAADMYRKTLSEHIQQALELSFRPENGDMLPVLMEEGLLDGAALDTALKYTAEHRLTELSGRLLEYRRKRLAAPAPKALRLDLSELL